MRTTYWMLIWSLTVAPSAPVYAQTNEQGKQIEAPASDRALMNCLIAEGNAAWAASVMPNTFENNLNKLCLKEKSDALSENMVFFARNTGRGSEEIKFAAQASVDYASKYVLKVYNTRWQRYRNN